ncbi:MAG: hypothetical protein AAF720_01720 [Pseudomonadota bacterium]
MSVIDQYSLDLPPNPAKMSRADFIFTEANRADLDTLDAWGRSDDFALAICGAPSSGKTHLAAILCEQLVGEMIQVAEDGGIDRVADGPLFIIDGLERLTRPNLLLEAVERARSSCNRLVLVGRGDPKHWAQGLRDLETRLGAISRLTVSPPDEELLGSVMVKLFADLQVSIKENIVAYAVPRLPRSLDATAAYVAQLYDLAVKERKPITIALARRVIDKEI